MKKSILAVIAVLGLAGAAAAQGVPSFDPRLAGSAVYSDPAFQDFVETAYGYKNPRNMPARPADLRDAVASPAVPAVKDLVFVSILPSTTEYAGLLSELSRSAGFVFKGERTRYANGYRQTRLLGWVRASSLKALRANPGIAAVRVGSKARAGQGAL